MSDNRCLACATDAHEECADDGACECVCIEQRRDAYAQTNYDAPGPGYAER